MDLTYFWSRTILGIGYSIFVFMILGKLHLWVAQKHPNATVSKPKVFQMMGAIVALVPIIVAWIILLIGSFDPVGGDIWVMNSLAWTHWPVLIVLDMFLIVMVGIGRWKGQFLAQSILLGFFFNYMFELVLYGVPLFFFAPFFPYEVMLYGFFIVHWVNFFTVPYLGEFLFTGAIAGFKFMKSRKPIQKPDVTAEVSNLA